MNINAIKTHKLTVEDTDLNLVLDKYIPRPQENSVIAVTSKIVSICEGNLIPFDEGDKEKIIENESQFFIPKASSKYNLALTITNNLLVATAGVDESNGNDYYVLWPKDPQKSANSIREFLAHKFNLKNIGVIITDSRTTPLRWGVIGLAISHSGFNALNDYTGKEDLFGRPFKFEKLNIADTLASAAVAVMGEGSEQTPLAIIEDVPFVQFQPKNPSQDELDFLKISMEEDLYAPLLTSVKWEKGRKN